MTPMLRIVRASEITDLGQYSATLFRSKYLLPVAEAIANDEDGRVRPTEVCAQLKLGPANTYRQLRRLEDLGALAMPNAYTWPIVLIRVDEHPIWEFVRKVAKQLRLAKPKDGLGWKPADAVVYIAALRPTKRRRRRAVAAAIEPE